MFSNKRKKGSDLSGDIENLLQALYALHKNTVLDNEVEKKFVDLGARYNIKFAELKLQNVSNALELLSKTISSVNSDSDILQIDAYIVLKIIKNFNNKLSKDIITSEYVKSIKHVLKSIPNYITEYVERNYNGGTDRQRVNIYNLLIAEYGEAIQGLHEAVIAKLDNGYESLNLKFKEHDNAISALSKQVKSILK